ncbi:MAG: TIGR02147 family protein [Pseudobdellovibrionaceae bacterium]
MSIYKHLKYRHAIEEILEKRRKLPKKFTLRVLADNSGLQASFLTNVLKGRFDFNADQLYAVATELGCAPNEREYLLLLLEYERSSFKPRREELKKQIEELRKINQQSDKHLAVDAVELSSDTRAQYYLDPYAQLTLVYLHIPSVNQNPEKLCPLLGISSFRLREILKLLIDIGYVRIEGGIHKVIARDKHLPKRNPLSGPHLALMRLKSIDQLQRLSSNQAYSHSVTFTGTSETKDLLCDAYLNFLKDAEAIVKSARSDKVFQMNFDLFPWTLSDL